MAILGKNRGMDQNAFAFQSIIKKLEECIA